MWFLSSNQITLGYGFYLRNIEFFFLQGTLKNLKFFEKKVANF